MPAGSFGGESSRQLAHDGLVDLLPAAVYVAEPGPGGRCLYISNAIEDILGYPPGEFLAEAGTWTRLLHPADRTRLRHGEATLDAGSRMQAEYRMTSRDGRTVWVLDDAMRREDLYDRPVLQGLLYDITDRKVAELMLAAQAELVEEIARGDALPEVLTALASHVEEISDASQCLVEVASANDKRPSLVVGSAGTVEQVPPDGTASFPLVAPDGSELGRLALRGTARSDDDRAEELAAWAVRLATLAVLRSTEQARMHESMALLEATLESTEDGILVVDSEGRSAGFNQKWAEMWRIDPELLASRDDETIIGSVLSQLVDPDTWVAKVMQLYDSPTETSFDEFDFLDGRVFERYSQPQIVDGKSVGRVWSFRDVTDKRQMQKDLELLSSVATAANAAVDVSKALSAALRSFCLYGGWQLAHAYLAEELHHRVLQHSVWHEAEPNRFAGFRERTEASAPADLGLPIQVLGTGHPGEITDLTVRREGPRAEAAYTEGLRASCAFPIMARDETVGVLEFFSTRSQCSDDRALRAMYQVGVQLGRVVERHRAERGRELHARELERITRRLDSVLNSAGEGIYGVDAHGMVSFVNEAALRLVGLPREAVVAHRFDDVVRAESGGDSVSGSTTQLLTGRHQRADGTVFDSESLVAPLVEDGQVVGSVVVLRDVSERRAVDRMKDDFISLVSHELRTPLTSIRGALGLLGGGAAGELQPKGARMVEVATRSTDRLIRLINDILDVERMAAGKLALEPRLTSAGALVRTTVEEMTTLAQASSVTLCVGETPGVVWADADRVVQALTNLVGNAVRFSPSGSTVDVTTEELDDCVRFDVRDHGPGIPPEQIEVVFERFRQADASDNRHNGGTGLGLAICRGLVEAHGGRIWATSVPGSGATFSFTLPTTGGAASGPGVA